MKYDHIWIGYTDRSREGSWRFLNGDLYDANDRGQSAVAYWSDGQPDNNGYPAGTGQNCGKIHNKNGFLVLDDDECDDKFYGLCEIKLNKCLS